MSKEEAEQMDDTIQAALNSVLEHDEESYEELCQNLSVLSQREAISSHAASLIKAYQNEYKSNSQTMQENSIDIIPDANEDDCLGDISTEELGVGLCVESQLAYALGNGAVVPKVGNFVDDNDDDADSESGLSELSDLEDSGNGGGKVEDHGENTRGPQPGSLQANETLISEDKTKIQEEADFDVLDPKDESCYSDVIETSLQSSPFRVAMLNKVTENDKLPGETTDGQEDSIGLDVRSQITNIDIKTRTKNEELPALDHTTAQEAENSNQPEVCSDAIEEFKLDENFDYDNVELTPRNWFS